MTFWGPRLGPVAPVQLAAVVRRWKLDHPGFELHHVFSRTGRLRWCQAFWYPLTPDEHRGKDYGGTTATLRTLFRSMFQKFEAANRQNRDQKSCWFACPHHEKCPLYEEVNTQSV